MAKTLRIGNQGLAQLPMRQETSLKERRPYHFASTSRAQQRPRQHQPDNHPKGERLQRQFTQINMPLSQALQHMLKMNLISVINPHPNPKTFSPSYNPDARCAYHSDSPGHDTNDCWALRYKIQSLIDEGMLEFTQDGQTEFFCQGFST